MSEPHGAGGITYSPKEMFEEIRKDIGAIGKNVDFLTRQVDAERNVFEQRWSKMEMRLATVEEQVVKLAALERDFRGFESRIGEHVAAAYHPSAQAQQATLILDVEQLKTERATRSRLDEYIRESRAEATAAAERAALQQRWLVGTVLLGGAGLLFSVARAVGLIG